jgi:predicted AlkP superfamily phosphohydrolase/phosphomutase
MTSDDGMDVLLIGIDAACPPLFDRLFESDVAPNLAALCSEGVSAPLESQIPPWTPSAWPSMFTGVNPGKHGVYGFLGFDGYDGHVVTGGDVDAHRLWTMLDTHDRSSVVVNVPVTHPPDEIDGAIVPGFMAPEDPPCHPDGILEDVRDEVGEYRLYPAYARGDDSWTDAEKIDEYRSLVRMRGEAFRYLADRFDPDFGFVQFQKPDTVFHEFHGEWSKVEAVYEETDAQVGAVLDACDPTYVFVASDHGIGRYDRPEFRVNSYLRDTDYVETTRGGRGMPTWNVMREDLRAGTQTRTWEPGLAEKAAAALASAGLTTRRIGRALERVGLADLARRLAPSGVVRTGNEQVDFEASTAYMRARTELGVRLNLEGREPEGTVPPSAYDEVRDALVSDLADATAPDGEPVFETVAPREEFFHGPHVEDAVDVVTVPNEFEHFLSAQVCDEWFADPTEPWNHKRDGIFVACGPTVDDGALDHPHLFDVAPTVLAALGVPSDERFDGSTLDVVDAVGTTDYGRFHAGHGQADEAAIEDRLADLGYVE